MRGRAVAAGAALCAALVALTAAGCSRSASVPTRVRGERLTRPATGLSVELTADRTTVRAGQPITFTTAWQDDDGRRLGWATLLGDEGAAKYVRAQSCPTGGKHPDGDRFVTRTSYARAGTYTAYVEVTTGGCGAAEETRRATVTVTVTP